MTTTQRTAVVGVFTTTGQANRAIEALHRAGFSNEQVGFVARHSNTMPGSAGSPGYAPDDVAAGEPSPQAEATAAGAISGGVLGGILGAAAALLIPGFGPAIAGGVLAATLGGIAIGAVAGGLIGALTSMGIPEEEARYYQDELHAGRIIVTVNAGNRMAEALAILRQNGAYDANTQVAATATTQPSTNYAGTTSSEYARPATTTSSPAAMSGSQYETLPPQQTRPEEYTPGQPRRTDRPEDLQPGERNADQQPTMDRPEDLRPGERGPDQPFTADRPDLQSPSERNPDQPPDTARS
jgi:rhodanese-related sulfurtransferase